MLPITPASSKGSSKKNKSSSSKKLRNEITPLSDKKMTKAQKIKYKQSPPEKTDSMLMDPETQPLGYDSDKDEEMQEVVIQPLTLPALHSATTDKSQPALPPSEEPAIPTTASNLGEETSEHNSENNEPEDDEDIDDEDIDDEDLLKIKLDPEILDDCIEITGGHVAGGLNTATHLNAYSKPSGLELFTVNPFHDKQGPDLAPTAYLPYDVQSWWNLYHTIYTSKTDLHSWAMVTLMDDPRN
ncbi:hypothetical protein DFH28DRAFT_1140404 [Melampsora americana]|nr:hypothetical protein DFH28DRAFT_1140404 [Melampsora americana]